MPPTVRTTPDSDGPPVKRLRSERLPAPVLPLVKIPSPRGSLDIVDEFASSSSRKQNQKQVLSFRDKLFGHVERPVPVSFPQRRVQNNAGPRTSITPIFKRKITAAFQDDTSHCHPSPYGQPLRPREPTPDTDPEDLLEQLKRHYLDTAETLHDRVKMQMSQIHNDLYRKLRDAVEGEDDFLSDIEKQNNVLCSPLPRALIRSQHLDPDTGAVEVSKNRVGDLVTDAQKQLIAYETKLGQLWKEWETAEAEVDKVYRETATELHGEAAGDQGVIKISETLAKFRAVIEKEIEEAEETIDELTNAVVGVAKDIEKDYRKTILPDLHIFFQSIDEP